MVLIYLKLCGIVDTDAAVTQLEECLSRKQDVGGSNPPGGLPA